MAKIPKDLIELSKEVERFDECLHFDAPAGCSSMGVIKAHTVSRSAHLNVIAENGYVFRHIRGFARYFNQGKWSPELVPTKAASTVPIFCDFHDKMFAAIDKLGSAVGLSELLLLHYRAIAYELSAKSALLKLVKAVLSDPRLSQTSEAHRFEAMLRGRATIMARLSMRSELRSLGEKITNKTAPSLNSIVLTIPCQVPVAACCTYAPFSSPSGQSLARHFGQSPSPSLSVSALPGKMQSQIIVSWDCDHKSVSSFAAELSELKPAECVVYLVLLLMIEGENTYWSPSWWGGLPDSTKERLVQLYDVTTDTIEDTPVSINLMRDLNWLGLLSQVKNAKCERIS